MSDRHPILLRECARPAPAAGGADLTRKDLFGKSEFMLGVSIKPRPVDFDLFHQSAEAENCYGPFSEEDLSDEPEQFPWGVPERLIWEGWLDVRSIPRRPGP